jgi:p-aminobenzoyl-glutamate transporter AbgT
MLGLAAVVLHVLSVLWLVSGIAGRDLCWRQASAATDLAQLKAIAAVASLFEMRAVRPPTFIVLVTGLLAVQLRGYGLFACFRGEGPAWPLTALLVYLSIIPVIVFVFLPKGRAYHAALAEAESKNEVTARLRAALADPAVRAARGYEMLMIVVLVFLMVAKPF